MSFNLVCSESFGVYVRGQVISDPALITRLSIDREDNFVRVAVTPTTMPPSPTINLSNYSFVAGAVQGTTIGIISVSDGTGDYTFSATDSASNQVQISGIFLLVGSSPAAAGDFPITVHADNGAGSAFDQLLTISATSSSYDPSLDFSDSQNSQFITII